MKININRNYYSKNIYNTAFTSIRRNVYNDKGELQHRNDTIFFRTDIGDWNNFAQYINNKFKNCDKPNIYSLACSSGDEIYSLIMKLINRYGEKGAEKFFPIYASDFDEDVIEIAKEGYILLFEEDVGLIKSEVKFKFDEYFKILKKTPEIIEDLGLKKYSDYDFIVKVKDKLREKVEFKVSDATQECKLIKPDNSLVMVRNFWPYLKDENTRINLAGNLYKSLGNNSCVVIGSFDNTSSATAAKNLMDAGFKCNPNNLCIFEKNPIEDFREQALIFKTTDKFFDRTKWTYL